MKETSKCHNLRIEQGHFDKYLHGKGIDIGCGDDPLIVMKGSVISWDLPQGNAELLDGISDNSLDFAYSSHCLEHLENVENALKNWCRVVKPGGFLHFSVPDYTLYEKDTFPSLFNPDHKHTFSIKIQREEVGRNNHFHKNDIEKILKDNDFDLLEFNLEDVGYDYTLEKNIDQTSQRHALAQVLFIARKRNSKQDNLVKNSAVVRKKQIGLCMIVKDEEKIITRCLESVKPLIDYVLIVDTGSTDKTIDTICEWLDKNNIEGTVITEPWQDFAYNRTFALQKMREKTRIDYVLTIDADEILEYHETVNFDEIKNNLTCDLYSIICKFGQIEYPRSVLFKNSMPYIYKGVLHEFLHCLEPVKSRDTLYGVYNIPVQDSNRNNQTNKYAKDAEVFEKALETETDPDMIARYTFYLAQSYKDCQQYGKAIYNYEKRAKMSVWNQEEYISYHTAAYLKELLKYPEDEIIQTYMRACEILPYRIEALHDCIRFCRNHNRMQQAYILGKHARTLTINKDGLFVATWMWDYGIDDEHAIVCYWTGHYQEGLEICENLIHKIPDFHKERINKHIQLFKEKLFRG